MRKQISKKVRFEIFKRDGFACSYCGATPPGAMLHVDHINPVANGGGNESVNLVTACESCNQGKGARLLSSIPKSLKNKSEEVAEREAQVLGYHNVMEAKRSRLDSQTWLIAQELDGIQESMDRGKFRTIKSFIEKTGYHETVDAAEIATASKAREGDDKFKYFCGVCWRKIERSVAATAGGKL